MIAPSGLRLNTLWEPSALGWPSEGPGSSSGRKLGLPTLYHRSAAVRTGASHNARSSSSSAVTVIEQPAISSEVQ